MNDNLKVYLLTQRRTSSPEIYAVLIFSKIQLVVYYQCCVLIG